MGRISEVLGTTPLQSDLRRVAERPQLEDFSPLRVRGLGTRVAISDCPTPSRPAGRPRSTTQPQPSRLSFATVRVMFALQDASHGKLVYRPFEEVCVLPLQEMPKSV